MNDTNSDSDDMQPSDHSDTAPDMTSDAQLDAAGTPKKKRKIPLIDPVFGKMCWFITVVPYVIYLGGMGFFVSYIEGSRVNTCIGRQQKRVIKEFYEPAHARFVAAAGGEEDYDESEVDQEMGKLGLSSLHKEKNVLAEYKSEEVREWFRPILEGPNPNESRAWLIDLYKKSHQSAAFLDRILQYDIDGKTRPILAEYFQNFPDEDKTPEGVDAAKMWFPPDRSWYPTTYTMVIAMTTLSMLLVFPLYFRHPFKVTHWSVIVGVVGIFAWIGLWWLDKNVLHLAELMGSGGREAFNPLVEIEDEVWRRWFMIIRFSGLVLVVPIIEEFFIRGWLMRYIEDPDWDRIPIGAATKLSIIGVAIYAVMSHPAEPLAAIVWFSMVTWLYVKTKSIWDCVIAHGITNLLLGIFVLWTHTWELW